jgi:2-methylisocitrate lyase-like PEP mutase family enzyme
MFINVRTDSFLLGLPNPVSDALSRIQLYQDTGVHGLFLPCITSIDDIKKITAVARLPVNVMCMPGLPGFKELGEAGVRRISIGPFLYKRVYQNMETSVVKMINDGNFESLFN